MSKKQLLLSACPLYLVFYMGDALLCCYYTLYFISRGLSEYQQSILLALIPFCLFIGCNLFSALAKTPSRSLWLFRFCLLAEVILVLIFMFCDNFVAFLILIPLIGIVNGAPFALIEGYLVPMVEHQGGNYSFIRLFGSAGYAVSLALGAIFLRFIPIRDSYLFSSGLFLGAFALSFLFHEKWDFHFSLKREHQTISEPHRFHFDKGAVLFVLSYALFYGAYNASTYLFPARLNGLGFLDADYSLTRSIGVVIEIVFLLLIPLIGRVIKGKKLPVVLSGVFLVLSTSMGAFILEPWSLAFAFFTLNSIGKALLFAYQASLLGDIVGEQRLASVLTVATGGMNLCTAILNLLSATLIEGIGFQGYFGTIVLIEMLGVALLFFLPKKKTELAVNEALEN